MQGQHSHWCMSMMLQKELGDSRGDDGERVGSGRDRCTGSSVCRGSLASWRAHRSSIVRCGECGSSCDGRRCGRELQQPTCID